MYQLLCDMKYLTINGVFIVMNIRIYQLHMSQIFRKNKIQWYRRPNLNIYSSNLPRANQEILSAIFVTRMRFYTAWLFS